MNRRIRIRRLADRQTDPGFSCANDPVTQQDPDEETAGGLVEIFSSTGGGVDQF